MHFVVAEVEKLSQIYRKLAELRLRTTSCGICGCGFECKFAVPSSDNYHTFALHSAYGMAINEIVNVTTHMTHRLLCQSIYISTFQYR